jgi:hypothetical protein
MSDELDTKPADAEPSAAVREVIDFAISFAAIAKDGKRYRIKRSTGDLVHTIGYYCDQYRGDPRARLVVLSESLRYLADKLAS